MTEDAGGSIHDRWIVFVTARDRSGTLTALAEMFSSRGVSFEAFNTLTVADGHGSMSIIFRGSARLARVLARTLERLDATRTVELRSAADPALRAVAVVTGAAETILAGSLPEVESELETLRAAGVVLESLTVLPPA